MKKVCIVQRVLTHYRLAFFEKLNADLSGHGISLSVIHGLGHNADRERGYLADLDWAQSVPDHYVYVGKKHCVYQPYWPYLKGADMVVVGQEMKLLLNYELLLRRWSGAFKLGLWGHRINHQEKATSLRNNIKKRFNHQADWWFVYTMAEGQALCADGFPSEKITVVQNSIDTKTLVDVRARMDPAAVARLKTSLGISEEAAVGLFCGGMYREKRLPFLIDACMELHKRTPDFHMIFIGGGPEDCLVKEAAEQNAWIHYVGSLYEEKERVPYFMLANVLLHPGLVGLAVLDSFALEVPTVTTQYPFHSPEIEYLEDGYNGVMTSNTREAYVDGVLHVLGDPEYRKRLLDGCRETVQKYSTETMVANFSSGIRQCLGQTNGNG